MRLRWTAALVLALALPAPTAAESAGEPPAALKRLSLDELFNVKITSVSKRAEPLAHSASAIQVITRNDILRSGATNLPEALRLATNLTVAQVNAHSWAVTARGFSGAAQVNGS